MSLPPALLNLLDQAKDALWAVTACVLHPSAKVKVNGRTCAYLLSLLFTSSPSFVSCSYVLYRMVGLVVPLSPLYPTPVKIVKVLGEGGFSFVYLCQDETSGVRFSFQPQLRLLVVILTIALQREFALKKIRCPTGSEDVRQAMREVEAYRRFKCVLLLIPHL